MNLEKLSIQQLQNEIWSYNNRMVPTGGLPIEYYQNELKKRMNKMIIKVYNDGNLVFTGPATEWLADNEKDADLAEMVAEAETGGRSVRSFFHSGEWIVRIAP